MEDGEQTNKRQSRPYPPDTIPYSWDKPDGNGYETMYMNE